MINRRLKVFLENKSYPLLKKYGLFFGIPFVIFILLKPGLMSPDSYSIYSEAKAHFYGDSNSPLMAFVWHYFDLIYPGPLLMFLSNLILLWGSIYILAYKIFTKEKNNFLHYFCLLFPLAPHLASYIGFVWKDLPFAFGYGLLSAYLSYKTIIKQRINLLPSLILGVGLISFTLVKYQAQFIFPIMVFWYVLIQTKFVIVKSIFISLLASLFIFLTFTSIQNAIVDQKENKWQYVKLYDLAGMSLHANQILVPKVLHKREITLSDIQRKYDLLWEPLVVEPDSPFNSAKNQEELDLLLSTWKKSILMQPLAYLKHRTYVWGRGLLFNSPGQQWLDNKLGKGNYISRFLVPLGKITYFAFLLPFQLLFFFVAYKGMQNKKTLPYGRALIFNASLGISLLIVLFVFSLAATPRYIYFTNYFFMISVPFAAYIGLTLKKNRSTT